ncbi:MAG: DNA adenine methylase [Chloroflexota bacterium]|nr:DNA adenine methylase [Chloroflexota bacterium]
MTSYRSPLRYPGGKSRAIGRILPQIPATISEYREPFIGGGSVYCAVRGLFMKRLDYLVGDLNSDLIHFWRYVRDDLDTLVMLIESFHVHYADAGRALYLFMKDEGNMRSELDRAVRFFIMNRITFSGVMDAGGYSQQAFDKRFTASSIERLRQLQGAFDDCDIIHGDYAALIERPGENVFIFLDPPYYSATESRLYGERGILHTGFDHLRFAETMRACPHRWLITYDDSPIIRDLFSFAQVESWELQYGMNNFRQGSAAVGKELFIRNY